METPSEIHKTPKIPGYLPAEDPSSQVTIWVPGETRTPIIRSNISIDSRWTQRKEETEASQQTQPSGAPDAEHHRRYRVNDGAERIWTVPFQKHSYGWGGNLYQELPPGWQLHQRRQVESRLLFEFIGVSYTERWGHRWGAML